MRGLTIARKTLRDTRGLTIGIGLALALIALVDVLAYPSYRDSLANFEMPELFKGFLGEAESIASPIGFMTTEFFSWAPVLAIIIAIAGGSYAVAGEEANGTLDLLLAQPISRASLLLQKCLALCLAILIAASASVIGFIVGKTRVEMGLSIGQFAQGVANIVPLALLFLGMALWASAALPTRSGAAMLVTGIVVLSFFLQLLGQSVPALATARKISPFYWAEPSRVLIHGFDWLRSFALLGLAALFLGLALWSLERRAIGTGSREWNWRPRLQWIGRLERPYRHLTEPAS